MAQAIRCTCSTVPPASLSEERVTRRLPLCHNRHLGQRRECSGWLSAVPTIGILLESCAAWLLVFWVPVVAHVVEPLGKASRLVHQRSEAYPGHAVAAGFESTLHRHGFANVMTVD